MAYIIEITTLVHDCPIVLRNNRHKDLLVSHTDSKEYHLDQRGIFREFATIKCPVIRQNVVVFLHGGSTADGGCIYAGFSIKPAVAVLEIV